MRKQNFAGLWIRIDLMRIRIRIRIQFQTQGFDKQKLKRIYNRKFFFFFDKKLQFT
jgi:hypothetical protein